MSIATNVTRLLDARKIPYDFRDAGGKTRRAGDGAFPGRFAGFCFQDDRRHPHAAAQTPAGGRPRSPRSGPEIVSHRAR